MRRLSSPSRTVSIGPSIVKVPLSPALASRRMARRSSSAARWVARPETNVCREADVLPASRVRAVSPVTSVTRPSATPSVSAQICASTVFDPWPMSTAPW
jgi:hypothetical protein